MSDRLLIAAILGFVVAAASYVLRFLTLSGAIATLLLAIIVFGFGGWQWTMPILAFFISSSVLSKIGVKQKSQFQTAFEKSSTRDWGQVAANGGVAGLMVVLSAIFPHPDFFALYLGAIAAVTADTWGTEIGLLSRGRTVSIVNLKPVPQGTSGGVSEDGILGGVAGAALIALSGYLWYLDLRTAFALVVSGFVGTLTDSLLGATLQVQYRCSVCGKTTERRLHCHEEARRIRGLGWMTNDVVNVFCSVAGAVSAWLLVLT